MTETWPDPKMGPNLGLFFSHWAGKGFQFEVAIFYQWQQWISEVVLKGEPRVYVNIDETSIQKAMVPRKGYGLFKINLKKGKVRAIISQKGTRSHCTLLACTTDHAALQPHLPQFVVPKDKQTNRREKAALNRMLPPIVWVQKEAGWVTSKLMPTFITQIRRVCNTHCPDKALILVLDNAPTHRQIDVIKHCSRLGVFPLFIPSKLTWLMQPLDSHSFARFKSRLYVEQLKKRQASTSGSVKDSDWVDSLATVIREVLVNRAWDQSFVDNGIASVRGVMRDRIVEVAGTGGPWLSRPPSFDEMNVLIGVRSLELHACLLRPCQRHLLLNRSVLVRPVIRFRVGSKLPAAPRPPTATPPDSDGVAVPIAGPAAPGGAAASGIRRTRSGAPY